VHIGFLDSVRVLSFSAEPQDILSGTADAWYLFKIPTFVPDDFCFENELLLGDRNREVTYLQIILALEGLYSVVVSGIFDEATEAAVIAFQEKFGDEILTPQGEDAGDGIVNEPTRAKLNDEVQLIKVVDDVSLFDVITGPGVGEEEGVSPIIAVLIGTLFALILALLIPKALRRYIKWRRGY